MYCTDDVLPPTQRRRKWCDRSDRWTAVCLPYNSNDHKKILMKFCGGWNWPTDQPVRNWWRCKVSLSSSCRSLTTSRQQIDVVELMLIQCRITYSVAERITGECNFCAAVDQVEHSMCTAARQFTTSTYIRRRTGTCCYGDASDAMNIRSKKNWKKNKRVLVKRI